MIEGLVEFETSMILYIITSIHLDNNGEYKLLLTPLFINKPLSTKLEFAVKAYRSTNVNLNKDIYIIICF